MFKRSSKANRRLNNNNEPPKPLTSTSASHLTSTTTHPNSDTAAYLDSLNDPTIIERVRVTIPHAHVFKLPTRQTVSVGWRGADWTEKVWQGTVKVVERSSVTAVLLVNVDALTGNQTIFAICPIQPGAVERCIDSSRYFVLRIENESGRHMFIGVAFNERNDAFDFNTSLEDARLEREKEEEAERMNAQRAHVRKEEEGGGFGSKLGFSALESSSGSGTNYSLKEGEKIRVVLPGALCASSSQGGCAGGGRMSGTGTEAFHNFSNNVPIETTQSSENHSRWENGESNSICSNRISNSQTKPKSKKGSSSGLTFLKPCARDTPTRAQLKNT